ncbi:MAG: type II secretion system protein GspE [Deltaproteobacteria bacterium]|nr:MAG: type II secretion system protein GspE [Deltaproteobacteria bacterium]
MSDTLEQPSTPALPEEADPTQATQYAELSGAHLRGRPLGEICVALLGIDPEIVEEALTLQAEKGGRLGEILLGMKAIDEEGLYRALSSQFDLPLLEGIDADDADPEIVSAVPINFAKQHHLLPIRVDALGMVITAVADPLQVAALDDLHMLLGRPPSPVLAPPGEIIRLINQVYERASNETQQLVDDLEAAEDLDSLAYELEEPQDLLDVSDEEAPIIRLVNSLLYQAVRTRASDIHIEPQERELMVRFRIDGVLQEIIKPPKRFQASIVSRVKVMAGLNIAEKRLPQDGRIRIKIAGRDVDIRVSTIPVRHGERVVMRLLDRSSVLLDLTDLGFSDRELKMMSTLIRRPHGIILVTGPTGSGKTTTLYACLSQINSPDKNILTVEDPIEYELPGISQMQVDSKIGRTFAQGLRSFLRQDPDVIMVGEIRDRETAEIAIQASLTGHLVLSTIHTNDAASAVTRLVDMGVEPFLVASSLIGLLAQRLVRVVCTACRRPHVPDEEELRELGFSGEALEEARRHTLYEAVGCSECNDTGYRGRTGIYELIPVTDGIRQAILRNADSGTLKKIAIEEGMVPLKSDGAAKVLRGITTVEEVLRVTRDSHG